MFERQAQHYLLLAALLLVVVLFSSAASLEGQFLGIGTRTWLVIAIAIPILHQFFVWFVWRSELHHALISRWFGKERGFSYYSAGFSLLFSLRLFTIIALAIANRDTLPLSSSLAVSLGVLLFIPWVYLLYSVLRYFGVKRAQGIDHFEESYRQLPFVREGMFRFSSNAMYVFGFFILWIPGLLFLSQAALIAAFFNHAYIWVHYYCTELPDMRRIYGRMQDNHEQAT